MSELFILQWHRQIDLDLVVEVMLTIVKIDIISTIVTTLQDAREELCAWHLILKVWIAKQKILEWLFGTHEESFQNPRRMLLAIKDSNPRMIVT